ncbi:MAG: rhomboid family intramembrane serine protease, partial [Akkermansiaceae bacterium]|nr:rhomboid family intramembrane serine protease [Akkermansiaceae bacterium]
AHSVGPWFGWALILAGGTLGNFLTALSYHPEPFQSVGASTATFGALGILVGLGCYVAWRKRSYRKLAAGVLVPIGAGVAMLGWLGAGGPQTDVLGHILGWSVGVVLGCAAAWTRMRGDAANPATGAR